MSGGRSLDCVWQHFTRLSGNSTSNLKSDRAVCKYCKKNIVALVARMKHHLISCQPNTDKDDTELQSGNCLLISILDSEWSEEAYVIFYVSN